MKTNLKKYFSIRRLSKSIRTKIIKQAELKDLQNTELLSANFDKYEHSNRIEPVTVHYVDSSWRIVK